MGAIQDTEKGGAHRASSSQHGLEEAQNPKLGAKPDVEFRGKVVDDVHRKNR